MSAKSKRFAGRIQARMVEVRKRTHEAVEAAGGPSSPTMTKFLAGDTDTIHPKSFEKLEVALELVPGSLEPSLANDTDLVPLPDPVGAIAEERPDLDPRFWDGADAAQRNDLLFSWIVDNFVRINNRLAELEASIAGVDVVVTDDAEAVEAPTQETSL